MVNRMKIKTTFFFLVLLISFSASAEFTTVTKAYEMALSDVRVPATPSSGIMFRECADCELVSKRVTPNTRYILNGKAYPLKEFRRNVFSISNRAATMAIIALHLESDIVTTVTVTE